ncbi:MAG: TIM-barrel domain-containing protein [Treponemataceae bacterium]
MNKDQNPDIENIMHGLSEKVTERDTDKIYQNFASFPRLSRCKKATLLLPESVKSVRVHEDHVDILALARYVEEKYTYRYFDYRPVFPVKVNTATICVRIGFCGDSVARITAAPGFSLPSADEHLLEPGAAAFTRIDATDGDDRLVITNGTIDVVVEKKKWNLSLRDKDGKTFYRQFSFDAHSFVGYEVAPFGFLFDGETGETFACEAIEKDVYEHVYGLGENFSALDRTGRGFDLWNTNALGVNTERCYKNIPFYISSQGYAAFFNSTRKIRFDMGQTLSKANAVLVEGPRLDFFIMKGDSPAELLPQYTRLTGIPTLPPAWSFGIWISKISYGTQDEVETVTDRMRTQRLPCDVVHIDTDWFTENWVCDWRFDLNKFPDVEKLVEKLHTAGFRISLWQLPYIERGSFSTEVYDYGLSHGYFASCRDGDLRFPHGLIDFSNPEAVSWYQNDLLKPLLKLGIDVIKVDFGESAPPFFQYAGVEGAQMHNLYALLYNKAVYEITEEVRGKGDAMIWARSAWAGSQKYPVHWGGDAGTDFDSLAASVRSSLSIGLSGFPFWSSDVGGFWFDTDPTLYIRWVQYGMLCSHVRLHGFYTREPWDFGEDALRIYRRYAELRYRLLPYILAEADECVVTSLPMHRALVIDYQDDPTVAALDTEYLFGRSLLVCPVLRRDGFVRAYLPAGTWTDFHTNERLEGKRWLELVVSLDEMPVFVRENAIIPMGPVKQYVEEPVDGPLAVSLYPGIGTNSLRLHGVKSTITMKADRSSVIVTVDPIDAEMELRFVNFPGRLERAIGYAANIADGHTTVQVPRDQARSGFSIKLTGNTK